MTAQIFFVDYTTERKRPARAGLHEIDYCPVCGRKAQVSRITGKDGERRTIYTHSETGRLFAGMVIWSNRDWHIVKGEK